MDQPVEFYRDSSRFDEIGISYEKYYGHDAGLRRYVHDTLQTLSSSAKVLDIGCGTGKPVSDMVAQSGRSITGIDYSSTMINLSRQQIPSGTFLHENMLDYDPSEKFDAAYSSFTLLVFSYSSLQEMITKIGSWIADDGSLFIATLSANMASNCSPDVNGTKLVDSKFFGINTPCLLPTVDGWKTIFSKAGLELIETYEDTFTPPSEADCNEVEIHLYLTAKKIGRKK